jgi:hypothetical protein
MVDPFLEQLVTGQGSLRQVGLGNLPIYMLRLPGLQIGRQQGDDLLAFPDHHVVGRLQLLGKGRGVGPSDDGPDSELAAAAQDFVQRGALDEHAREHNNVGPADLIVRQRLDVEIHEADLPALGEHRRHRDETQGRQQAAPARECQRESSAPIGIGESGIDQQRTHRASEPQSRWTADPESRPARGGC